jgi:hypothetical protein
MYINLLTQPGELAKIIQNPEKHEDLETLYQVLQTMMKIQEYIANYRTDQIDVSSVDPIKTPNMLA